MSLEQELVDFAEVTATRDKLLLTLISGNVTNLSALATTDKTTLVAAINEVLQLVEDVSAGTGAISDGTTSTTTTWSSTKIADAIEAARQAIIGGASAAYDTLVELQNEIQANDTDLSGLLTAVGNRVRFDAPQVLSDPQKAQARDNIGAQSAADIGDPNRDLVAVYNAALV